MCQRATKWAVLAILAVVPGWGQSNAPSNAIDWRRIGDAAIDASLAAVATGAVDRVWFSNDGGSLWIRTRYGKVYRTGDRETWQPVDEKDVAQPAVATNPAFAKPEASARIVETSGRPIYAFGKAAWRSDDLGRTWTNLTHFRGESILGDGFDDMAVSPNDSDEIVVASRFGVWRSVDGGLSWSGLNHRLPNLPVRRLLRLPQGGSGTRVLLEGMGEAVWAPGEKLGWRLEPPGDSLRDWELRSRLSAILGEEVLSAAVAANYVYAGGREGRLWASSDQGATWRASVMAGAGAVASIIADRDEPRLSLAVFDRPGEGAGARVARTVNGGLFWDDLTSDLPGGSASGIAADRATGAVYVATDAGLFFTYADLTSPAPATPWRSLQAGLPRAPAVDVKLDDAGHQLFIALEGHGVYATSAPHRQRDPRLVNAADFSSRAAAPGSLLSVLGRLVQSVRAGQATVPVLAASARESQIQVPFEAAGASIGLVMTSPGSPDPLRLAIALRPVSPAIFVDRDGTPMLLEGDSGILLDAMKTARSGTRVQILATGLGKVRPDWPTGLAAPLVNVPAVVAPVKVFLDRMPVEVSRATLAPGYIGFYLIEFLIPDIVNSGPAELYLEAGGQASNRVRIYLEQ